jgi:hypothetical protein
MTYAEILKKMMQDAVDSTIRNVKGTKVDKLDWHPAETSRSARELLDELIMTTRYTKNLVLAMKDPGMSEDPIVWKDLDDWATQYQQAVDELYVAVAALPEEKLTMKIELPWASQEMRQSIEYAYWNCMYHWGQIAYIQTMYGDKDMY